MEMHLPALETLRSKPGIHNKLFLQSSLLTRHRAIQGLLLLFGVFFSVGWYRQGAKKPPVVVFVLHPGPCRMQPRRRFVSPFGSVT